MKRAGTIAGVILGIVVLAAIVGFIYWVFFGGATLAAVRDVAIIFISFLSAIVLILLIVVAIVLMAILFLIRDRVVPILEKLNETATTVKGTSEFVSAEVVKPLIRSAGFFAGSRALVKTLVKRPRRR